MNWLMLTYFLSMGMMGYHVDFAVPQGLPFSYTTPDNTFETTMGVEALIAEHIFVGGSVQTWETKNSGLDFSPMMSFYTFSAGVRWNGFEVKYQHECDHITPAGLMILSGFSDVKDEITVSYTGSVKVF